MPLIEPARTELEALQKADDYFPHSSVFPIGKEHASDLLRELLGSLELKGIGLHTLRHSFASCAARTGIPPFYVKEILGHASLDMTAYYFTVGAKI